MLCFGCICDTIILHTSSKVFLKMVRPTFPLPPIHRSFRFFQMPQQTEMNCSNNPGRWCSHRCRHLTTSRNFPFAENSKGKANLLLFQTSFACSQSQRRWPMVSSFFPQSLHTPSGVIFLYARFSFEARMFRLAFHAKSLIFCGIFRFQIVFHNFLLATPFEHSAYSEFLSTSSAKV